MWRYVLLLGTVVLLPVTSAAQSLDEMRQMQETMKALDQMRGLPR